jgi:flagellar basal body-associated protein FliL
MAKPDKAPDSAPATGAAGEEGEKKSNILLVLIIIVVILAIQVALVYLIVPKPVDEDARAAKAAEDSLRLQSEAATRMGAVTSDAPIKATVNIAGTEGERYLKAEIILEYDEKNVKLGNELRQRTPRYRDMFIKHLSTLTLTEVTDPDAKDKIQANLLRMINADLPVGTGEVQKVLIGEYIIQ